MCGITVSDLSIKTSRHRKIEFPFHKTPLQNGCMMIQFSLYMSYCSSREQFRTLERTICALLPNEGSVRIAKISDSEHENTLFKKDSQKWFMSLPQIYCYCDWSTHKK